MPRPKPPAPLVVRSVRLSDAQWVAFDALGGSEWLRSRLDKLRVAGIAKRQRNNRMRAAAAVGKTDAQIAEEFNIDRSTAWRTIK